MKKTLMLLSGFLILSIIIGLYYYTKPVASLENSKADFSIDASLLFDEFDENEMDANIKYLDQIVAVSGSIAKIGDNKIELETKSLFGVICEMESKTSLAKLKVGDQVICKGVCTGKLMDVVLIRCILISK